MTALQLRKKMIVATLANIAWNLLFVLMAASELAGLTSLHAALPWWLKWIWISMLAAGNLFIHYHMLRLLLPWQPPIAGNAGEFVVPVGTTAGMTTFTKNQIVGKGGSTFLEG